MKMSNAVVALLLLVPGGLALHAAEPSTVESVQPENVALMVDPSSGSRLVHFPSGMRLYYFDDDSPGKSACNAGCDSAWPPLVAPPGAKSVGAWVPIVRYNKVLQWTYKGRPVYMRYHDSAAVATGDGVDGKWHFLVP